MKKIFDVQSLLWLALLLALAGSLKHMAAIFASVDGNISMGWIQAIAIDAGLFALAYSIKIRKVAKRSVKPLWLGVVLFSLISIYGNYAYGILATLDALPGWILSTRPIVLAASLPILVLFLAEILSDDRQYIQAEAEKEAKRLARQTASETDSPPNLALLDVANEVRKRDKEAAIDALLNFLREYPEATHSEAGRAIGRSKSTIGGYLAELEQAGRVYKNGNGYKVT